MAAIYADRFYKYSLLCLICSILCTSDPYLPKYDSIIAVIGLFLVSSYTSAWMSMYFLFFTIF